MSVAEWIIAKLMLIVSSKLILGLTGFLAMGWMIFFSIPHLFFRNDPVGSIIFFLHMPLMIAISSIPITAMAIYAIYLVVFI